MVEDFGPSGKEGRRPTSYSLSYRVEENRSSLYIRNQSVLPTLGQ